MGDTFTAYCRRLDEIGAWIEKQREISPVHPPKGYWENGRWMADYEFADSTKATQFSLLWC
jgi:hypothetical protein